MAPHALHETAAEPHLVLVGLPGSGKSSAAREAAKRLHRPFVDFDIEIERRAGMPVHQIFATRGEADFRAIERALTVELSAKAGHVLAPGGGWMAQPGNAELLRPPAIIIYIRVLAETALGRIRHSPTKRPLLDAPDPLAKMRELLASRDPMYSTADVVIDAERLPFQRVVQSIIDVAGAG